MSVEEFQSLEQGVFQYGIFFWTDTSTDTASKSLLTTGVAII